ncbi:DUF1045 domain-containing protein [Rhodoligotrophos defluvii]|uniref:DUF1045 domain-containing protein n=1 Tax=Rhodoligotrophos defluvii TaxID=2561934 RepID=UPI0010C96AC9|nr:DUF1045 domain-containing protein [Rhodoligotrophos defluvii]
MRHAIYFTPDADDPLTMAAEAWLGRSAFTGAPVDMPAPDGFSAAAFRRLTAEPRRYGFHATLVAPFRLRDGLSASAVASAAQSFARGHTELAIPRLAITPIGSFLALTPAAACPEVDALASSAVDHFNGLRAPLTPSDVQRRRPERLTARQRAYLDAFGYPHVKEEFRFHMTLTSALEPEVAARIEPALQAHFAAVLDAPLHIDAVAVFVEPEPGADFTVHSIHRFGSAAQSRKSA